MRIVEKRRGDLLGLDDLPKGGRGKTVPSGEQFDVPRVMRHKYRQIARYWEDVVYPCLLPKSVRLASRPRLIL